TGVSERVCDAVDNDGDGTADDGLTGCSTDHDQKRLHQANLFQGDAASMVNVVEGTLMRTEVDAVVEGPYGPLVLSRTLNSRRSGNDGDLGPGWTHSFAVKLIQLPAGDDRWRVQTASGEFEYFRCCATSGTASCTKRDSDSGGLPSSLACVID